MNRLMRSFVYAGMGAGLMYFFDPNSGRRRRALARDKALSTVHKLECAADVVRRDMENRIEGFKHGDISPEKLDILQARWAPATRFVVGTASMLRLLLPHRRTPTSRLLDILAIAGLVEAITNTSLLAGMPRSRTGGDGRARGSKNEPERVSVPREDRTAAPAEHDLAASSNLNDPIESETNGHNREVKQMSERSAAEMGA